MYSPRQVEHRRAARQIGAAIEAGSANRGNREALGPLPRLLLMAAALATLVYRRAALRSAGRQPQAAA